MQETANTIDAAAVSARRLGWMSGAEVLAVTASILLLIWVFQPLNADGLDLGIRLLVVAAMIASNRSHGDSRLRLGLRLDNFRVAARLTLGPTLTAAAIVVGVGLILGLPQISVPRMGLNFLYYTGWAFAQQYALQGFVLLRLVDMGLGRQAPMVAGAVFALIHTPNPGLMVMVFFAGWMWSALFRREPSLPALALSHALLAVVAEAVLPTGVTGGYRLGPRYLDWASG